MMTELSIEEVLDTLREALRARTSAVLQAPPGAGKTTRVPLALLDEPWLARKRILMLEPRRLAARAAAQRMAATLGERVGQTVGYRVRMDTCVGADTHLEVVTEGVLTRLLQADAALEGVGLVIFDEYHERNLHADLGLALCLQSRAVLRDDLRILIMSATLDGAPVARLLDDAPIITSEGRSYPVETRYRAQPLGQARIEPVVTRAVRDALSEEDGDVLVFLPGAGEIRRVEEQLREERLGTNLDITPLYGALPQDAQERAIKPGAPGRRKVVLATSIAETSLTIEGIQVVIDSGLMRVPRFSPRTGMTRLETIPVTRASAAQRRGRAGRLGPGVCYRLWTAYEHQQLLPHGTPEILAADLVPLALELAAWGVADPAELSWLDLPPAAAFAQARELLTSLGALDHDGVITPHGRDMAEIALHPRLAHMTLRSTSVGAGAVACELAALLSERDIFRGDTAQADADLCLRLEVLRDVSRQRRSDRSLVRGHSVDRGTLQRVLTEAAYWKRQFGSEAESSDIEAAGLLLAFAYPDRIAQRRAAHGSPGTRSGRFLLRNGRGAAFTEAQPLSEAHYLTVAELDGQGRESRIFLAAPLELADLEEHFADQIEEEAVISWDSEAGAVRARRRERLGALVLKDVPLPDPDPEAVTEALIGGIDQDGLNTLPWSSTARQLQQRLVCAHRLNPSIWPNPSDDVLTATLRHWLAPHLHGITKREELLRLDLAEILQQSLSWEQRRDLDEHFPTHCLVPSGSRLPIDYSDPDAPVLAVRLQEVFGLRDTPRIARGSVALTLHLLSPARRPVQVTQDLASFWRSTYFEVKKDLKGRYPKHYWPDDPLQATPTSRAKPRR
jgi:ATP-dependent helicase HrpB